MYDLIKAVKFNDQLFEHGDEVIVTKNDDTVIIGSVVIKGNEDFVSDSCCLRLDVSEKYHQKTIGFYKDNIKNIQKVNQ